MRLAYTLASVAIRTVTAITIIMVADRTTAADRVGRCRAASVNPIVMVRGTSMGGGRATTGSKIMRKAASAAFSFSARS